MASIHQPWAVPGDVPWSTDALYRALVETSPDAVTVTDTDGRIVLANRQAAALFRCPDPSDLVGRMALDLVAPEERERAVREFREGWGDTHGPAMVEYNALNCMGERRVIEAHTTVILNEAGRPVGAMSISRDVTEHRQMRNELREKEAALLRQATRDALTGLPNRTLLTERLERSLHLAHQRRVPVGLLLLDIDGFKEINDTFGHAAGDSLLQQAASRLHGLVRDTDTVARLGGDEFGILLPGTGLAGALRTVGRVREEMNAPFVIEGHDVIVRASTGVCVYPTHGSDAASLLRHADVALYVAKRERSGHALYQSARDTNSVERLSVIQKLQRAVENRQFVLEYQPKVSMADMGAVMDVEALVRWNHPERGLVPPSEFLPLAEETGVIGRLTSLILDMALQQCGAWRRGGMPLSIAVNLSARNLQNRELVLEVRALLQKHDVPPSSLILEVTENAVLVDPERARSVLEPLHGLGVRIAMDDFGTGYSSLAHLRSIPISQIKIHGAFVRGLVAHQADAAIVRAVIGLGKALRIPVVAEGVERRETLEALCDAECDAVQGMFVCPPYDAGRLERWMADIERVRRSA